MDIGFLVILVNLDLHPTLKINEDWQTYVIDLNNDETLVASFLCLQLLPDQIRVPNGRAACRFRRDFYRLPFNFTAQVQ
jgi:hypothetical protein